MAFMIFLILIIGIFLFTFIGETESLTGFNRKPAGLLRWLTTGNWPAKVGAGLMIIGFGALLRYLMLHIDLPPEYKSTMGVTCAFLLGVMSAWLRNYPKRRAIHLALAGAALGVAYITAYSQHAYFGYYNNVQSLCLLFLVASAGTAFAIASRAMSIAILAMFGAYFAPVFGYYNLSNTEMVGIADVIVVYSYYLLVSLLCLLTVSMRGWRPLIHLSLLFTLAGGLFFALTRSYYLPEYPPRYYNTIQPLLLAMIAVHLAMPLLEKQRTGITWMEYFDNWYFFLLPVISLILILSISPNIQDAWQDILLLFALWLAASIFQYFVHREQAVRYACIALILLVIAALMAIPGQPLYLIGIVLASFIHKLAPRLKAPDLIGNISALLILFFFASYVIDLPWNQTTNPFLNMVFFQNMLIACMLIWVGINKHKNEVIEQVFKVTACFWFMYILFFEIVNLHLQNLPQILYIGILVASALYVFWLTRNPGSSLITTLLSALIIITGLYAAKSPWSVYSLWIIILSGQIIFSFIAFYSERQTNNGENNASITRSLLPVILFPWAFALAKTIEGPENYIAACFIVSSALFASVQAQYFCPKGRIWPNTLTPLGIMIFGSGLLYTTLLHIEHGLWPLILDLLLLTYLLISCHWVLINKNKDAFFFVLFCLITVTTFIQSVFLRIFGPENHTYLTIMDLGTMHLPALVSLSWIIIGASLCVVSNRIQSRTLWSSGVLLLGLATLKLIFFDFGSLEQLGNIIAMILSGGVFMGLAWFVPIPPKSNKETDITLTTHSPPVNDRKGYSRQWLWILAAIIILFSLYNNVSNRHSYFTPAIIQNDFQKTNIPDFSDTGVLSSRPNSSSSPLKGYWEHNHHPTSIRMWNNQLMFCNEQDACAEGMVSGDAHIFVPQWDVRGSINKNLNMISWSNGTIWIRTIQSVNTNDK